MEVLHENEIRRKWREYKKNQVSDLYLDEPESIKVTTYF